MTSLEKKAKWRYVGQGHCAYRGKSVTLDKPLCNHLLSVSTDCQFVTCPIIQDKYISFQRFEDTIYQTEKDAAKGFRDMWTEKELTGDLEQMTKEVEKTLEKYPPMIAKLAKRKFEYLAKLAIAYRESLEEEPIEEPIEEPEDELEFDEEIDEELLEELADEE